MATKVKLIETGAVTGNIIPDGGIATGKLADDAVTTIKISDGNITHEKLHTSMDLTGKTVTVATAAGSTNTTAAASTAFVQQELTTLIGGAPSTLDTLNELAAAINDDASYASTLTTALATKLPLAGGTMTGALYMPAMPTVTIDSATEYSTTETSELSPVATDALFLYNEENSSTNGKVSILMRSAGGGGAASARITLKNERSGSGGLGFFFRDNGHTAEQQEKMYLSSDGDIDTAGLLKVGVNDSEYANNYIRFKPTGAAYIDHNTVGQDINFRTSASSSLDNTPLTLKSDGTASFGSNVGIGCTPSAWAFSKALQIGDGASLATGGNQNMWLSANLYLASDATFKYITNNRASQINLYNGGVTFSRMANGTAGATATPQESGRFDNSGNFLVGAGSTSTRAVITPDAVFQSYYSTEAASRIHLGRDVGIGGGAGVAFGGTGGYSLIGTDNTSGTNLYFNAGSNAVGSLTTGHQMWINGSTDVVGISSGLFESKAAGGGGQIGLGDWSNTNPIGISEGLWNTVGTDNDFVTVYARQHFNVRGYSGGTTHWLSLNTSDMVLQQNQKLQVGSLRLINAGIYTENHVGVYAGGVTVNAATSATGWLMSAGSGRLSWDANGLQTTGDVKINEAGAATDFKVSTDNRSHMINVVGSNDEVRIGSRRFLNPVNAYYISSGTLNRNITVGLNNCGEYYLKIMITGIWPYSGSNPGVRIIEVVGFGSSNVFTVIQNTHYGSGPTGSVTVTCANSTLNVAITTGQNYRWEANCEIIQGGGGMTLAVDGVNG